jgi:hypothetical protein
MIYGYARVATDGQSVEAQTCRFAKAGCAKVLRETASGAQTDRAQLQGAGRARGRRRADGDAARPPRPIHPQFVEHARHDHGAQGRVPILERHMGGHHDRAWALDAHRVGRLGRIRTRIDPHTDRRRPRPRHGGWREDGTQAEDDTAPGQRGATPRRCRRADAGDRLIV